MANSLRTDIQSHLRGLPTQKLAALKQLFWSDLSYDQGGAPLATAGWPEEVRRLLAEPPQLFATAGDGGGFHVLYCRLHGATQGRAQPLSLSDERVLVGRLLAEHPYALFVFSDRSQTHWHFVNVKYEQDAAARARRVFRRINISPYETAGPVQRLRTATERLSLLDAGAPALALQGLSPLVLQSRHDEAFDVEAVTRDFFATYRAVFEQVERLIKGLEGEAERLFTQRLFNRLLFLVFLERKGWLTLEGRSDYLRALWEAHQRELDAGNDENFYRDRLRFLFFSALNTPNEVDIVGANRRGFVQQRIGHVPYLNGGLFEEDATDRSEGVVVPDRAIELILERLLYHYNFTITESTPLDVEVAVDPEMLGKIFEELVTGRHESGSYYTPKPVVAFMGQEALKGYLEHACADENAAALAAFVERCDPASIRRPDSVLAALRRVTICDPACGSGAYLLGMMHELMGLRGALAERAALDHQTLYEQKLEIIQQNLYGVDIDPFAVNIARLRLWLSLIVEFEGDTPPPLPNLDFKIETGDSLTAPNPASQEPDMFRDQQVRDYFGLKNRYMQAHGGEKGELRRKIDTLRQEMRVWAHRSGEAIDGFDWVVEFAEVFDGPDGAGLTLSGAAAPIINASAGQMELAGDASGGRGFDIILANPPYVRQELLRPEYKALLRAVYPEVHAGTADLYVYFYARALQLVRQSGMVVFISSNKFMRAGYGQKLRRHLVESTTLRAVIDYGDLPLFTATAYPCIVATCKALPAKNAAAQVLGIDNMQDVEKTGDVMRQRAWPMAQSSLRVDGWALEQPEVVKLMTKLREAGRSLGEVLEGRIYCGIKTGLNEAYIVDETTKQRLIAAHPSSSNVLKPFIRGRDVRRWNTEYRGQYLIRIESSTNQHHPWSGKSKKAAEETFKKIYPAIYEHFERYRMALVNRYDQGEYYWELRPCAYWDEFSQPKIMYQEIATFQSFAWHRDALYCNNKVFIIPNDDLFLLGLLNSKLTWFFLGQTVSKLRGGAYAMQLPYIEQIPVPDGKERDEIAALVKQVLAVKAADGDVTALEAAIDAAVYRLFGVGEEEIGVVEGK